MIQIGHLASGADMETDLANIGLFLGASLVCILMPGPAVLYVLANGIGRGVKSSIAAACGTTAGVSVHLCAAIIGLAAVLHTSALLFTAIKLMGAAYLICLAWLTIRSRDAFLPEGKTTEASWIRIFWSGFGINILNPKLSIFFLAFLPQFVSASARNTAGQMLFLGVVFMLMTIVVFILYGVLASQLRNAVISRPKIACGIRWALASVFATLGLRIVFAEV